MNGNFEHICLPNFAPMVKALIVDDEFRARTSLFNLLREYCPQVTVTGMAENVNAALQAIIEQKPDIVLLDIDMPDQNGFQLLQHFENPDFEIIFTTAYSEFAVKAFEVSAIDYLLKPLEITKLQAAVDKVSQRQGKNALPERVHALRENLKVNQIRKIALPVSGGLEFVQIDDIFYLEAEGSYTRIVTAQFKLLISKKIKEFEYLLSEDIRFFRIHRSFIINTQYITKYIRNDGTYLQMENGATIPVARERKQHFETLISNVRL
jgi:two-component system LytT family response regulator